ncbi:endonuclease MutS2 [Chloroflexota bacterium]
MRDRRFYTARDRFMMDEKSLEMLEYPQVREIIAGYTSFNISRELALSLTPLTESEQINELLTRAAEASALLEQEPDFDTGGIGDISGMAKMAAVGRTLDPLSLVEVKNTLGATRSVRSRLKGLAEQYPLLWQIAQDITEQRKLEKDITACISLQGEVLGTASPGLAAARREMASIRGQLLEKLNSLIQAPHWSKVLQEPLITERQGRYVIPIKIENRNEVRGIVHDISNTGATIFIEPASMVGLGNALRESMIAEKHEIEKILGRLSAEVGLVSNEICRSILLAAEIDLNLAKARFSRRFRACVPTLPPAEKPTSHSRRLKLVNARHPLLGDKAVPFSLDIGEDQSVLVITGPNTGGKTVTLKTIGLLCLMAQAGLPITADGESVLPVFDHVFADIGDEQSIEQTLSTFSWHIGNMVRITSHATSESLVLIDELGTSTDPAEGAALAQSILEEFLTHKILTVATTHFASLKAFAYTTDGMVNAAMEFNPETYTPTYRLHVGVPGGSNALTTAARLGLPPHIIETAKSHLSGSNREMEKVLVSLSEEQQKAAEIRRETAVEQQKFARLSRELEAELKKLRTEERQNLNSARDRVVSEAAEMNRQLKKAAADLRRQKNQQALEDARQTFNEVRNRLNQPHWQTQVGSTNPDETIREGDTVWLAEAGIEGKVVSLPAYSNQAVIQLGRTKVTIGRSGLEKRSCDTDTTRPKFGASSSRRAVPLELDLRGKRSDEVEPVLDVYLGDAIQYGLKEVRVIHGHGTGVVRSIVRDFTAPHPLVQSIRPAEPNAGGDGVTVIELAQ